MARLDDLKKEKQIQEEIRDALKETYDADRRRTQSLKESKRIQGDILKIQQKIDRLSSIDVESEKVSLAKQLEKLQNGALNSLNKELGLEKTINKLSEIQGGHDKQQIKDAKKYTKFLNEINDGNKDLESVLRTVAEEDFGTMNDAALILAETLKIYPELLEDLGKEDKFQKGIGKIQGMLDAIDLKKTFSFAAAIVAAKSFLDTTLQIKQSLGASGSESIRLASNLTAASVTAKALGGNSQEAQAAVTAMVDEFGELSIVSLGTSVSLAKMVSSTGLTGANAAKLLKSMEAINGASIETNIALIKSTEELARAEGVSPAQVLNDVAENTETFAQFAKDGGQNIAAAAIQARKLGLNLGTVAGIAESLLDFESSIEKEMEASMLIGRQMNLDKARELALTGDLEGLAKEVKNQVGSQAEFEAMNVVQRKALADAMGVTVADMGKMVAGEKTSGQLAEEKAKKQEEMNLQQLDLNKMMVVSQGIAMSIAAIEAGANIQKQIGLTLAGKKALLERKGAIGSIARWAADSASSAAKVPFIGPALAIAAAVGAAALGMKLLSKSPPGMEAGGVVKETGMAEVHRGEVFSGTKNEAGFGTDMTETNGLLKQSLAESKKLREQNEFLMNRLTGRVDGLALSN
jgi:hypothetical protein